MSEEKILGFLNIDKHQKNNKFLDKIFLGFNIGFTVWVGSFLLLSSFTKMHIAFAILFIAIDLLLGAIIILNNNPAVSYIIDLINLFWIIIKLVIGYVIFLKLNILKKEFQDLPGRTLQYYC